MVEFVLAVHSMTGQFFIVILYKVFRGLISKLFCCFFYGGGGVGDYTVSFRLKIKVNLDFFF